MTHFALFQYYGIDWAAMILMIASLLALELKNRSGFTLGGAACLCWIIFGIMVGSVADIIANVTCFVMNALGFVRWSRSTSEVTNNVSSPLLYSHPCKKTVRTIGAKNYSRFM